MYSVKNALDDFQTDWFYLYGVNGYVLFYFCVHIEILFFFLQDDYIKNLYPFVSATLKISLTFDHVKKNPEKRLSSYI